VDIIVAGGSNTRLFDENDRPRAGDLVQGEYPIFTTDADGNPVAIVNTDGNYKYVGRLVLDFDENGLIIPTSYDAEVSGAYATDAQGVAALNAEDLINPNIQNIVDSLRDVIIGQESNVFGISNVFLNGDRGSVRTEETNLGNLTADANLAIAQTIDPTAVISLKNGGGIRNNIGQVVVPTGSTGEVEFLPTEAVLDAEGNIVKPTGGISQNDIANALSFNNGLSLITVTAAELLALVEHGVAESTGSNTPGRFPQVSGFEFSFDLTKPAGDRIQSLAIKDDSGAIIDVLVQNGELQGDASRTFRMVTLGFLADGGDGYPFPQGESANRVDLAQATDAPRTGNATFAPDGTEQDALAEYLFTNFLETPFNQADTTASQDTRIQNLGVRSDTVIPVIPVIPEVSPLLFGGLNDDVFDAADPNDGFDGNKALLFTGGGNDLIDLTAGAGKNRIFAGSGDDEIYAGKDDLIFAGEGNDTIYLTEGQGGNRVYGGAGNDDFFLGSGAPQSGSRGDRLFGGTGDDRFFVGTGGNNIMTGGEGADQFWIVNGEFPAAGNRITDFTQGVDVLRIGGNFGEQLNEFSDLKINATAGVTRISVDFDGQERELVTLNGEFNLTANDVVFA
jgi:Ca2+-binding RTX toxin-like protein